MTRGLLLGISSGAHMKARPRCSFTLATLAIKGERAAAMPHGSPVTRITCTLVVFTSVPLPLALPTSASAARERIADRVDRHRDHPVFALQAFNKL